MRLQKRLIEVKRLKSDGSEILCVVFLGMKARGFTLDLYVTRG